MSDSSAEQYSGFLKKMDDLLAQNKVNEVYDTLLDHKNSKDPELLWRLAAAGTELGRAHKSKSKIYEAFTTIERALALANSSAEVRKVYVNVLRYKGEYEGISVQLQNSYLIKAHLETAKLLNPNDPAIYYSLGCWSFAFADAGRVTRKLAGSIGVTPPKSTFEDAKNFFLKAEELQPGFRAMNLCMLGKTLRRLKENRAAIPVLQRVVNFSPLITPEDHEAHKKAVSLLKKM